VAQLGARFHGMEEVVGSIPTRSTIISTSCNQRFWPLPPAPNVHVQLRYASEGNFLKNCPRPRSLQEKLYVGLKGTDLQLHVANPRTGSIHNYGLAIDLSLQDRQGHEIDTGTPFDDFTALAQEHESVEAGRLSQEQLQNRQLLRKVMTQAALIQLHIEWWHYDALPKDEVKKNFEIAE
jgi:D-alanyl-D-alanine dipeptidase